MKSKQRLQLGFALVFFFICWTFLPARSGISHEIPQTINSPLDSGMGLKSTIYVVIVAYNRGVFLEEFIRHLNKLHGEGRAENVKIQAQFHDEKYSAENLTALSTVPIQMNHILLPFSKAQCIQRAYEQVRHDLDGIFFAVDADMKLPHDIFSRVRASVSPQKTFFAPIIAYINKDGSFDGYGRGGYGNIAASIQDINRIGSVFSSEMLQKKTWGGEDDDFVNRLWEQGLSAVRYEYREFEHKWHPKVGSWDVLKPTTGGKGSADSVI